MENGAFKQSDGRFPTSSDGTSRYVDASAAARWKLAYTFIRERRSHVDLSRKQ
jgi:hypothetical protein